MNRLWVRLSLAFLLVALLGVGVVAATVNWTAGGQFQQYLARQGSLVESGLLDELAAFYVRTGNWNGVAAVFGQYGGAGMGGGMGAMMGRGPVLVLADAGGRVVYDPRGMHAASALSDAERRDALPVAAQGATVGYLLVTASAMGMMTPLEQSYLDQLRNTLIAAALLGGVVSVGLGLILSRTVAAPLTRLAAAARSFAAHNWGARVAVTGTSEVADVSRAFNAMADELQRAEIQRRDLVADVAHELRTPLTVLQGNLRALLDGVYPLERAEIATLYDETRLLARLVDDLREIALAEAGQLPLNLQALDPRAAVKAATTKFAAAADMQGIALADETAGDLPAVRADADRLAQVMQNLVANALRHTPSGGRVTLLGEAQGKLVRIRVQDTGEGIPADDLPHVFDRFYRGDRSRARQSGGSGLGLTIAKTLVEAMGGTIGVESAPAQGTRFWFTLPIDGAQGGDI